MIVRVYGSDSYDSGGWGDEIVVVVIDVVEIDLIDEHVHFGTCHWLDFAYQSWWTISSSLGPCCPRLIWLWWCLQQRLPLRKVVANHCCLLPSSKSCRSFDTTWRESGREQCRLDLVLELMNPEKIFQVGNILKSTSTTLESTNNLLESTSKDNNSNPQAIREINLILINQKLNKKLNTKTKIQRPYIDN